MKRLIFNKNNFLNLTIYLLFFLAFLSVPICSFNKDLYWMTWVFTVLLLVLILFSFLTIFKFQFDFINLSLILFCLSAIFSTCINDIHTFIFRPIFLTIFTFFIYSYCKANKDAIHYFYLAVYVALVSFLLVFIIIYFNDIFSFNFKRLGKKFGDINDIAIFLGLGFSFTFFNIFFYENKKLRILFILPLLLFLLTGISTGSKIFVLIILCVPFLTICLYFGKKRWWMSLIVVVTLLVLFGLLLQLPFMATIKTRLIDFVKEIMKGGRDNGSTSMRMHMFQIGIDLFCRKPLFGFGIDGFGANNGYNIGGWSHNNFSEMLCNYGIVGTFLYNFGFVSCAILFCKNLNIRNKRNLLVLFFFFVCMFSVALDGEKIYAYFIGIILADSNITKICDIKSTILKRERKENNYDCGGVNC